jgi:hypothetical protein
LNRTLLLAVESKAETQSIHGMEILSAAVIQ